MTIPVYAAAVAAFDVRRRFGEGAAAVDALRGVTLRVRPGELVAVRGPVGAGASTLLRILAGRDRPTSGRVELAGCDPGRLAPEARRTWCARHVGEIDRGGDLAAELSVLDIVRAAGAHDGHVDVEVLLDHAGLRPVRDRRAGELGRSQRQRVALIRALARSPSVLLADEPTGDLDRAGALALLALISDLGATYGHATVLATHDARTASAADRVLLLSEGALVGEVQN
jgi:putative ABC transport system ATP-binding protein